MSKSKEINVEYVDNLTYKNYKQNRSKIIETLEIIIALAELNITELSKLTGLHWKTLNGFLNGSNSSFKTCVVLNNTIKKIIEDGCKENPDK